MQAKNVTGIILMCCVAVLVGWDIFVAAARPLGSTISEVVLGFSLHHPALPLAVGIVCGHLFWPQKKV